jgi:hypothetical protein
LLADIFYQPLHKLFFKKGNVKHRTIVETFWCKPALKLTNISHMAEYPEDGMIAMH